MGRGLGARKWLGPREGTVSVGKGGDASASVVGALPSGERAVSESSAGTESAGRTWSSQGVAVSE